ncbi:MAG: phosphate ABC transporter permease subunit PstC [Capsulimonadaceae bacterium]|nr:phosphate ABC transporter permease subunit PstC [Capsulimonadaceae bacterium]
MASTLAKDGNNVSGGGPSIPVKLVGEGRGKSRVADRVYDIALFLASLVVLAIIAGIVILLFRAALPAIERYKFHFLFTTAWDPIHQNFGALLYIFGTIYSSFWALLIAVPISLGAAIFLSELAPSWIRTPVSFLIELLAAIPSVVYGIWGVFVLSPWLNQHLETPIHDNAHLAKVILFQAQPQGSDMLAAALILAIMVTPYITSVSRDILRAIPRVVRDGSFALGATQWETIERVVLPYARAGVIGAVILGLGRALGETMAVTMVIGNSGSHLNLSLFAPGYTMASIIANELPEASTDIYRAALIEIGLLLFVVTMIVNAVARLLVLYTAKDINSGGGRKA